MMTVYIKLTIAGSDAGPFDLYSDVDSFVTAFELGVTREDLVNGYTSYLVPTDTTQIKVQSTGNCTNSIIINVTPYVTTTTTTSSTSTTTTLIPTTTTTTTALVYDLLCTVTEVDCSDPTCPKSYGQIMINAVVKFSWNSYSSLPRNITLHPSLGDTISIDADCNAGGSCSPGMDTTTEILVDSVQKDYAVNVPAYWSFTYAGESTIDVVPGCTTPL